MIALAGKLCRCEHCRERWEREVGTRCPPNPRPETTAFPAITPKNDWTAEFVRMIADHVKAHDADLAVEFDGDNFTGGTN